MKLQDKMEFVVGYYGHGFTNEDKFVTYVNSNEHKFNKIGKN